MSVVPEKKASKDDLLLTNQADKFNVNEDSPSKVKLKKESKSFLEMTSQQEEEKELQRAKSIDNLMAPATYHLKRHI